MKKMLFLCTAVLAVGIASAQDPDTIYSKNIVGYQVHDDSVGTYKMVGCVFTPIMDPAGAVSFSDTFIGEFEAGDEVQFLQPSGEYALLRYYVGNLISLETMEMGLTGWGDAGIKTDYDLVAGTAFWLKTTADFHQAGQVQIAENNQLLTSVNKFTMISAPYPVEYKLSDLIFTGVQAGDEVQFLKPDGEFEVLRYYVGNLISLETMETGLTGWGDAGVKKDYTIPSANGFWIKTASEATAQFPVPASL